MINSILRFALCMFFCSILTAAIGMAEEGAAAEEKKKEDEYKAKIEKEVNLLIERLELTEEQIEDAREIIGEHFFGAMEDREDHADDETALKKAIKERKQALYSEIQALLTIPQVIRFDLIQKGFKKRVLQL